MQGFSGFFQRLNMKFSFVFSFFFSLIFYEIAEIENACRDEGNETIFHGDEDNVDNATLFRRSISSPRQIYDS